MKTLDKITIIILYLCGGLNFVNFFMTLNYDLLFNAMIFISIGGILMENLKLREIVKNEKSKNIILE